MTSSIDEPAAESEGPIDTEHYLRAVSELGDTHVVKAGDAIFSANGIKLVDKGTQIDSDMYERLVQHKLREPIDTQLTVDDAVDVRALVAIATALVKDAPLPRLLAGALLTPVELIAPLGRIQLPGPMSFRLTLMRAQQPTLLQHSVEMALVAIYLGIRSEMRPVDLECLATAAVLHDLGMLYMDPAWHDPKHRLSGVERKQLAAHPITAMLMLRSAKAFPRDVERAVLEHHERHDGTGYPRGVQGDAISPMGKILLLAEIVSAMFEKYTRSPAQRLSLVLRLKHRMFDERLVGFLIPLLREEAERQAADQPASQAEEQGEVFAGAVEMWTSLRITIPPDELAEGSRSPCKLLDTRLQSLLRSHADAGNHPNNYVEVLESLGDDAEGRAELELIGREAMWELQTIVNACDRRWPDLSERSDLTGGEQAVVDWCNWVSDKLPPQQQASIVQPLM